MPSALLRYRLAGGADFCLDDPTGAVKYALVVFFDGDDGPLSFSASEAASRLDVMIAQCVRPNRLWDLVVARADVDGTLNALALEGFLTAAWCLVVAGP